MPLVTDVGPEKPDARRGCGSRSPVVHILLSVLLDLINGVRDPSHVEARKLVLKTARIGLPSLPQEVSGLCLEETQRKSIDRTLVVSSELPEQTHGVALSTDVAVARLGKANSERMLRVRDTGT
jgi:hypothetical protein